MNALLPHHHPSANPTTVPFTRHPHKGFPYAGILLLGTLLATPAALLAQRAAAPDTAASAVIRPLDVATVGASGAVYLAPQVFDITGTPSTCAPCNRADVPGFDRWAIHPVRSGWGDASTGLLFALTGFVGYDLARRGHLGLREAVGAVDAASVAVAAAQVLKVVTNRKRPVFYTADAPQAQAVVDNRRSFPSGHTTAAFAIATSYFLARLDLAAHGAGAHRSRAARWIILGAAATVGVLRVAAGEHFPSDVLAGAALGAGSAVIVHAIKF